jgi:hypothetical protein
MRLNCIKNIAFKSFYHSSYQILYGSYKWSKECYLQPYYYCCYTKEDFHSYDLRPLTIDCSKLQRK